MRTTSDPNYATERLPGELAGKMYEVFEPRYRNEESNRPFNELVDVIATEMNYQKDEGVSLGRTAALRCVRKVASVAEVQRHQPAGYDTETWYAAVIATIADYCNNDDWNGQPGFWQVAGEYYGQMTRDGTEAAHA